MDKFIPLWSIVPMDSSFTQWAHLCQSRSRPIEVHNGVKKIEVAVHKLCHLKIGKSEFIFSHWWTIQK